MLLLTLLPFVGWAAEYEGVTVTVNPTSAVYTGNVVDAPTVTLQYQDGDDVLNVPTDAYEVSWNLDDDENVELREEGVYTLVLTVADGYSITFEGDPNATEEGDSKEIENAFEISTTTTGQTTNEVELQVQAKSTCQMVYGSTLSLTGDMITLTPINAPAVVITDALKDAVAAMLVVNQDLSKEGVTGPQGVPFDLGFKDPDETQLDGSTIVGGSYAAYTFNLSPIGSGRVKILKGENILNPDAIVLADGLTFNGKDQVLVDATAATYSFISYEGADAEEALASGTVKVIETTGEGDNTVTKIEVLSNKSEGALDPEVAEGFVGNVYCVKEGPENFNEGERYQLFEEDGETETQWYVKVAATGMSTYNKVQFLVMTPEQYDALFEGHEASMIQVSAFNPDTWAETNEDYEPEWNDKLPTGKWADTYYVWAKAADGESNYSGGDAEYIGAVTIGKGVPQLKGTITLDPIYYTYNGNGNKNGLYKEVKLAATDKIYAYFGDKDNPDYQEDVTAKVVLMYQTGTPTDNGGFNGDGSGFSYLTEATTFEVLDPGKAYQIGVRIMNMDDNKNLDKTNLTSSPRAIFEVAKPTLTLHTTVNPAAVAYGKEPAYNVTYEDKVKTVDVEGDWIAYKGQYTPVSNKSYKWYMNEACTTEAQPDNAGNYRVGTYYVRLAREAWGTSSTHDIRVLPAVVTVGQTDTYAYVEPQTLVYGQNLPGKLKYDSGDFLEGSQEVQAFENADRYWNETTQKGLIATPVKLDGTEYVPTGEAAIPITQSWRRISNNPQVWVPETKILPVGTYKVTAVLSNPTDARKILVGSAIWTIVPKNLDNTKDDAGIWTVTGLGDDFTKTYEYTGKQIKPTYNDIDNMWHNGAQGFNYRYKKLVGETDYEITGYGENITSGEDAGSFTVKGKGNFTGEVTVNFDITKKTLTVKPQAGTTQVGVKTVNFEIDWDDLFSQLVLPDTKKYTATTLKNEAGFSKLAVKRLVGNTTWGYNEKGLEAYKTDKGKTNEEFAQNYDFEYGTAPLSIAKGLIKLQVMAQTATYNGTDQPDFVEDFEVANKSLLNAIVVENWKSVVTLNNDKIHFTNTLAKDDKNRYLPGNYTIDVTTDAGWYTSTNYEVELIGASANLRVNKADLKLKAKDRGPFTWTQSQGLGFLEGLTAINNESVACEGLFPGDEITDVVTSVNIEEPLVTGKNEITLSVNEGNNITFYNVVENKPGVLTINPLEGIVLYSEADVIEKDDYNEDVLVGGDWKTLLDNNGKPVDKVTVYIKQPVMTTGSGETVPFQWRTDEWQSLVLPFAVNTRDISRAFGYAIVNVVDPENTVKDNVKFKFMKISQDVVIPANTPFLLKTDWDVPTDAVDKDGNVGYPAVFDQQASYTITLPEDANGNPVKRVSQAFENDWGYTIDGTYEAMPITGADFYLRFLGNNEWNFIKKGGASVFSMQPYYGFVNLGQSSEVRNVIFTMEEEDGTTTAIKAVDFLNGNKVKAEGLYRIDGIKLQSAPTQKGVYIQDGKKFVK